ncbi:hypothetical protein V8C34DRAFT_259975 [Trichoderma compactum]
MTTIILHHFDASPFGEKIRLIFGLKALSWKSVDAELILPKPKLTALTGGYRKTPVMQIGSDIYCDSRLIAEELEARYPSPSIFSGGSKGICLALSTWSDTDFHIASSGLTLGVNKDQFHPELMADRKAYFQGFMDVDRLDADIAHLTTQLRAHASLIEEQLSDGRRFWLGSEPSPADFHAYVENWTARAYIPFSDNIFAGFGKMVEWEARVKAIGHGRRTDISTEEALEAARSSPPNTRQSSIINDELDIAEGDVVVVTPDDCGREPVTARLVALTVRQVAIEREHGIVGRVVVHFPRIGFRVEKQK